MARKILLADDSVTAQNMGRKILTDAGYDVITVNNGSAALKRVAEQKPDLIVLDVYMPGYSGLEVCVRLKDAPETARIPILLTVGKLEPFKPEEATRVRADGFIVKPFEASELLSALTRLEDRVVPAHSDGSRFSTQVSGLERFSADPAASRSEGGDDSDTGWKNRLRFPSKKKKEEPEPEPEPDFVTPSSFRDFRRGAGKAPAGSSPFPLNATSSAAQEPGLVPDIPRDITPEELDALSELVAKLDGVPAAEQVAPISENIGPAVASATEVTKDPAPATAAPATKTEVEAVAAIVEAKPESEVVAPVEAASEKVSEASDAPLVASSVEAPTAAAEVASPEAVAEVVIYKTETAVAQEAAPIDRDDEPMFAAPASPPPEVAVAEKLEEQAEAGSLSKDSEQVPDIAAAELPVVELNSETRQLHEPTVQEAQPVEVASVPQEAAPAESPSAEELAEALRFLTPYQSPVAAQTLAEAGAMLANELSRGVADGSGRWVAEAVALSPEEASASLEAEMFRTFAPPSGEPKTGATGAAASVAAGASSFTTTEAVADVHAPAVPIAPAPESMESAMAVAASSSGEFNPTISPLTSQTQEALEEPAAAMTFADAGRSEESESVSASVETVGGTAAPVQHEEVSGSENEPGSEEAMGKETKGKGGKSNWHQIRSGVPSAETNAVEAAKQAEEPKSMAAAASADHGTDASNIASIVDSVLADLRPKIVEEIARQLAKK